MTNKQKIAILKKMRAKIKQMGDVGFCYAWAMVTGNWFKYAINEKYPLPFLKKLGLRKPKKCFHWEDGDASSFWYDPEDSTIRIRKIDELIKRLSK